MSGPGDELDTHLLAAHERDDLPALVALYTEAADRREKDGDRDGACFFLTQAYVYALQAGDSAAGDLQKRLWENGREVAP